MLLCGIRGKSGLLSSSHPTDSYGLCAVGCSGLPLILSGLLRLGDISEWGPWLWPFASIYMWTLCSRPRPLIFFLPVLILFVSSVGHTAISGSPLCYT